MTKKSLLILFTAVTIVCSVNTDSFAATFSQYWIQDSSGNWKVKDPAGQAVTNAWLCDDAVPSNGKDVWYLLDGNGNMVTAALVKDGTGNYYSLETGHNGYFGMLRFKSGAYNGIPLDLEESHDGSFAAVKNAEGIAALTERYGVTDVSHISNANCVYTSSFSASEGTGATLRSGNTGAASVPGQTTGTASAASSGSGALRAVQSPYYQKIIQAHESSPLAFHTSTPVYGTPVRHSGTFRYYYRYDHITPEMIDTMVDSLEKIKNQSFSGSYQYQNTGIYFDSYAEAYLAGMTLYHLFGSGSAITIKCQSSTECRSISGDPEHVWCSGDTVRGAFLFVGWQPGCDPQKELDRHYRAKAVIDRLVAAAPEGESEKAEFFHDKVCEMTDYDFAGLAAGTEKHNFSDAVLDGCCVCSGYADLFFNLCYYSGMQVAEISVEGDTEAGHVYNAVKLDGIWYKYDCTNDDNPDGTIDHAQCKVRLSDSSQQKLNTIQYTVN